MWFKHVLIDMDSCKLASSGQDMQACLQSPLSGRGGPPAVWDAHSPA